MVARAAGVSVASVSRVLNGLPATEEMVERVQRAVQELGYTLADGREYVRAALARGQSIDAFAPRLSFFFNSHLDFFEEIGKFSAARRIWARWLRDRYLIITAVSGLVLIAMGVLLFTGELARLNIEAQRALDNLGLNFFKSV